MCIIFCRDTDAEWNQLYYTGATFKYEAIAIADGVEGQVLTTGNLQALPKPMGKR